MRRMWELMLTGAYSPRRIWEIATRQWGLTTVRRKRIGGQAISLSAMYRIFTNPFYAGMLISEGKIFPGKHQAMVTVNEYEQVQRLLGRPGVPRATKSFAFTGMIRCGECGFSVTGEEKTNRWGAHYTYYHCSKRRLSAHCPQPYLRLEEIEKQILKFLEEITIPDQFHQWLLKNFDRTIAQALKEQATQKTSIVQAQNATARELSNLAKLRIRDLLTDAEFIAERQELERRQIALHQQLEGLSRSNNRFEPLKSLVSLNAR